MKVLAWYIDPNGMEEKKKLPSRTLTQVLMKKIEILIIGTQLVSSKEYTSPTLVWTLLMESTHPQEKWYCK
jgi:hypothetical protein